MTLAIMFGLFVSAGVVMSVIGIYAKNLTGLDTYAGMMFTTYGMGALAVRFLAGNLVDRFSAKSVILAGTLILGVGSLWQYLAPDITQLLFSRVFQGAGFGLATTAAITQLAMICPPSRLVDGVGFGAVAQSLSAVLSPLIGFRLIGSEYTGFPLLFLASLAIVGVTFLLVFFTKQGENSVHTEVSTDDGDGKIRWSWLSLPVLILFLSSLSQSSIMSFLPLFAIEKNFGGVGSFFSINAIGMIASRFVMGVLVNRYKKFPLIFTCPQSLGQLYSCSRKLRVSPSYCFSHSRPASLWAAWPLLLIRFCLRACPATKKDLRAVCISARLTSATDLAPLCGVLLP